MHKGANIQFLFYKKLSEEEAVEEFYGIHQEFTDIQKIFNVLDLPVCDKFRHEAATQASIYLKDQFNLSEEVVSEAERK